MRLKRIVEQNKFEEKASELENLIDYEEWIVKTPILFRGSSRSKKLLSVRETDWRKKTKDTPEQVDALIHGFYKFCYSEYPMRRKSVFASTDMSFAKNYGDLFVILPHKSAKLSAFYSDPIDMFNGIESDLYWLQERVVNNPRDVEKLNDELSEVVDVSLKIHSGQYSYIEKMESIPCPSEIVNLIDEDLERHIKKDTPNSLHQPLKTIYKEVAAYFEKLKKGYPNRNKIKDVMIEGKYIQVDAEIFEIVYGL